MRRQAGFATFEWLLAAPLAALTLAVGVPLWQEGQQQQQLRAAAETLHAQLRLARTRTVMQGAPAMLSFTSKGARWHYALDQGETFRSERYPGVRLGVIAENNQLGFEPVRGIALSVGQVRFRSSAGEIRVSLQPMGRIERCSPAGELKVNGYADCANGGKPIQIASAL